MYDREEKKQFVTLTFPVNHSVQFYMDWKGYQDDGDVAAAEKKFGTNVYGIPAFLFFCCFHVLIADVCNLNTCKLHIHLRHNIWIDSSTFAHVIGSFRKVIFLLCTITFMV